MASWGYDSVLLSAHKGVGLAELYARLQSHTSVVAGPSGVGKSSLINALHLDAGRITSNSCGCADASTALQQPNNCQKQADEPGAAGDDSAGDC